MSTKKKKENSSAICTPNIHPILNFIIQMRAKRVILRSRSLNGVRNNSFQSSPGKIYASRVVAASFLFSSKVCGPRVHLPRGYGSKSSVQKVKKKKKRGKIQASGFPLSSRAGWVPSQIIRWLIDYIISRIREAAKFSPLSCFHSAPPLPYSHWKFAILVSLQVAKGLHDFCLGIQIALWKCRLGKALSTVAPGTT